jgi:hypothetical protein
MKWIKSAVELVLVAILTVLIGPGLRLGATNR